MGNRGVKVFAPASIANLSVGFDLLGLALEKPGDDLIVRKGNKRGITITRITGDAGKLPTEINKNTAGYAAKMLLEHLGEQDFPIEMEIHKKMPFNSGLGSSAASAVAGAMAVNEILGRPLTKRELLPFAVMGEEAADGAIHADNVAPSLFGGIILVNDLKNNLILQLPVPVGLTIGVIHPNIEISTKQARSILNKSISLKDHIQQSTHLASFIASLYTSDFDLLSRSLQDIIIEPQRSHLIPHFAQMKELALSNDALAFGISGAGPSVFILALNNLILEKILDRICAFLHNCGISSQNFVSKVNMLGAYRY